MKTTYLNFAKMSLYLFMGLNIILVSCSGEDGKDGIDGNIGPQGPAGKDGNANIIVSDWFKINWTDAQPTHSTMQVEVPEVDIETFVANGGVVLVYIKIPDGYSASYLLPFVFNNVTLYYGVANNPDEFKGILIAMNDFDNQGTYLEVQNNPDYMLRYVLIPFNIAQASDLVNKMPESFGEAANLLGLEQ